MAAAKAMGSFKRNRKQISESDLWLQKAISSPEKYGVLGMHEGSNASESERKTDQQTYSAWKAVWDLHKFGHPLRMRRRNLVLQPLVYPLGNPATVEDRDSLDPFVLSLLRDFCTSFFFGFDVMVAEPVLIRKETVRSRLHPSTNATQLLATDVFRSILRLRQIKAFATLGVTNVDLYPSEEWNFSLGHASTTDGCGVFSIGHYHDQRLSAEPIRRGDVHYQRCKVWRLIKVVTHETCHMFGLAHCSFFHCLMNESSSIPEAESQPLFLCPVCLRKMHKALKFDILTRYSAMLEQLKRLSIELRDTCHCASRTRETAGSEKEGEVVCDTGGQHSIASRDSSCVVDLEWDHSSVAEVREEEPPTTATCKEQVTRSIAPHCDDDVMQEEGSSCSMCDCQLEHMRKATKWLEMQLCARRTSI